MKFVVTLQFLYEFDGDPIAAYGTSNPEEMAAIDQQNMKDDPGAMFSFLSQEEVSVTVRPVKE